MRSSGPESPLRFLGPLIVILVIGWPTWNANAESPAGNVHGDAGAQQKLAFRDEVVFRKLNGTLETKNGPVPAIDRLELGAFVPTALARLPPRTPRRTAN